MIFFFLYMNSEVKPTLMWRVFGWVTLCQWQCVLVIANERIDYSPNVIKLGDYQNEKPTTILIDPIRWQLSLFQIMVDKCGLEPIVYKTTTTLLLLGGIIGTMNGPKKPHDYTCFCMENKENRHKCMGYKHLNKIIVKHKFSHSNFVSKTKDACNMGRMSHMSCLWKNLGWML